MTPKPWGIVLAWIGAMILAVCPAQSAAAQNRATTQRLSAEIARIAAESKGVVGVAAVHVPSGRQVVFNSATSFPMASTLKLPLAIYAFKLGQQGRLSLTTPIAVERDQLTEPGILFEHFRHPGLALSTANAIELSLTVSDNGATDFVYARVGGPQAVNGWLRSIGLAGIDMGARTVAETFDDKPRPAESPLARTATPAAMAQLLARLQRGQLLDGERTALVLSMLERAQGERLSLQLPPGVSVRHKTGTLFGSSGLSVNDVGVVEMPNGDAIAIAVFIKDSPESVTHATRDKVIGAISRAIYDYFLISS